MRNEMLYEMLRTGSVSGDEIRIQKLVRKWMAGIGDKVISDNTGNLTHIINPEAKFKVQLIGHIDEIGLCITHITDSGMLKVTRAGGIRNSMYLGHKVRIYNEKGIVYGSVLSNSSLLKNNDLQDSDLTIDIGATNKEEALAAVSLGDSVTIDEDYRLLLNDRITARALDDRTGAFIVLEALRRAKELGCKVGVYATTSVGEETTGRGAYWSSSRINPDLSIAVDVTYATDYEGTNPATSGDVRIGGGPVLCNSSLSSRLVNKSLRKIAKDHDINVQTEAFVGRTGTDADTIHQSNLGVTTALVSLPLRYMHSHSEVGSLKDLEDCIELLAHYVCSLNEETSFDPYRDEE